MIKKLRRKFIVIAMSSLTAVLVLVIGIINIMNYVKVMKNAEAVLDILAQNRGQFPNHMFKPDKWNGISQETPFEMRYFTATVDENGQVVALNLGRIAAVSEEEALSYVERLVKRGKTGGRYRDFKYTVADTDDGRMYILLDCGRDLTIVRNFLLTSALISAGGLFVVLVLILLLSKFVLRPIEENELKQKSFITNVSHDIKTPLTVINAETEIIDLMYGENEYTDEIKKQVARLDSLTKKLVFLSRMEEMPKPQMNSFNLSKTLEDVIVPYEQSAIANGFHFTADVGENIMLLGNEELIREMASLLLDNALKYARRNGNISVMLKRTGKTVEMTFFNDAEEQKTGRRDELFERFYRGDQSRNSEKSGNGIGLSVVKAIVEQHKGKVSAESPDGNSLLFTVLL